MDEKTRLEKLGKIVVETLNETPKKKEPEFKVEIDNKFKS